MAEKKDNIKKDGDRNNVASQIYKKVTNITGTIFFVISCLSLSKKNWKCFSFKYMTIVNSYKYYPTGLINSTYESCSKGPVSSSISLSISNSQSRTISEKKTRIYLLRRQTCDLKNRSYLLLIMSGTRDKRIQLFYNIQNCKVKESKKICMKEIKSRNGIIGNIILPNQN